MLWQFEGIEGTGAGPSNGADAGASAGACNGEKKREREQSLLLLLCLILVSSRELVVQTFIKDTMQMMLEMLLPDGTHPMVCGSLSRQLLADTAHMHRPALIYVPACSRFR